ncbi:MAG: cation diffusion facilitator family transporter [Bacteroidales bacterium]|nr:cation diffusion facilitator family transporter [Bacteroidales bacterium]
MSWFKKEKEREYWLMASVWLNLFLSAIKLFWGWQFHSTVVTADGIHSISDVFGAFFVFMALRFAGHKSKRFPFGLNKLEDLAATLGGIAIVFAGYEIIRSAFFSSGIQSPENIWGTTFFILVVIIIEAAFYFYERKASIRLKSPGVKTDAVNWLGDIGSSFIVLAGIIGFHFSIPYAEKAAVVVIVVMIFYGAYGILRDALLSLLEASVDKETLKQARDTIKRYPEVSHIEKLFIRRSGSILIADIVLQVKQRSMQSAHLQVDKIEGQLRKEIPNLAHVTIHYEPEKKPYFKIAVLLDENTIDIATSFNKTVWIKMLRYNENGILFQEEVLQNPVAPEAKGKAIRLAAWLIKQDVEKVIFNPEDLRDDIKTLFSAMGIEIKKNMPEYPLNQNQK